ncbi:MULTISPECIES: DUF1778 domain-containing protein [Methylobacterium]|uniref:Uncharacterized protein n=1 Tax=Methylobacterium isbiliense TaxID=315478 RepID=A0ABQ4SGJ0_9HYPH|nr:MULTISPECIES: DUF1778 domain-containing protein [Methylobacterium]MBY0298523.1 hypothetical protein [Methylobacterium sp.]MDN3627632.1 hypothetical protein [Methylobacterium isbiliense]GJE02212.1 hypothetical protein GMJLKIPL_4156 [Methylobacterium isbiliense]
MSASSTRRTSRTTSLRLTPQERRTIERASAALRIGPSTFVRLAAVEAARQAAGGGRFRDLALARWTALMGELADKITDLSDARAADAAMSAALAELLERLRDIHHEVTHEVTRAIEAGR